VINVEHHSALQRKELSLFVFRGGCRDAATVRREVMQIMNRILNLIAFTVLFGVSLVFGLLGKATEMGLAILAGVLGLAFLNLDKLKRFKGAGFEAEMKEKIEGIVDKETEPQRDMHTVASASGAGGVSYVANEQKKKVIEALFNPTYTWRYAEGISKESELSMAEVSVALHSLLNDRLVSSTEGDHGTLWCLTARGRNVLRNAVNAPMPEEEGTQKKTNGKAQHAGAQDGESARAPSPPVT